jgi:cellulose synthase/poly-beta-1,6-N-acetylglucosamine synthase-like glycosyltransferase
VLSIVAVQVLTCPQFTNLVYTAIQFAVANGDIAPFVGHNAVLRWSAIQDIVYTEDSVEKWWAETTVSEDFDMALRLQSKGYDLRFSAYFGSEGFQEGVSLTVYDELARWEKYAYGRLRPVHFAFGNLLICEQGAPSSSSIPSDTGSPAVLSHLSSGNSCMPSMFLTIICAILTQALQLLKHVNNGQDHNHELHWHILRHWLSLVRRSSHTLLLRLMFIILRRLLTVMNYFLIGWFNGYLDHYYTDSFKIYFSIVIVFQALGTVSLAVLRYVSHPAIMPLARS